MEATSHDMVTVCIPMMQDATGRDKKHNAQHAQVSSRTMRTYQNTVKTFDKEINHILVSDALTNYKPSKVILERGLMEEHRKSRLNTKW